MNSNIAIIVFELQHGHYYVECDSIHYQYSLDKSTIADMRKHRNMLLARHPIVRIHNIYQCPHPWMDSVIVKQYMTLYGINNVRGGMYYKCELDKSMYRTLHRELYQYTTMCIENNVDDNDDDLTYSKKGHVIKNKNWVRMILSRIIRFRQH